MCTDINEYHPGPVIVNKIEDKAMLVGDPERPESFQDTAEGMGFEGRMKKIFCELDDLFGKLLSQFRVLMGPLPVDLFELIFPDEFNHSDPQGDLLLFRSGSCFSGHCLSPLLHGVGWPNVLRR